MNRILLILATSICLLSEGVFANNPQIYNHNNYGSIKAFIGADCHNRISFEGAKIRQVIGDQKEYQLVHNDLGGHIFILPKIAPGKHIHISIIAENNQVQEFELEVKENYKNPIIVRFGQA